MTKDNDLDRDGEALEEISSNHGDDKQARPKTGNDIQLANHCGSILHPGNPTM